MITTTYTLFKKFMLAKLVVMLIILIQVTIVGSFAEIDTNTMPVVKINNLIISGKSNNTISGTIDVVNKSSQTLFDMYVVSELYISTKEDSNLINKVYYPIQTNLGETEKINLSHKLPFTIPKGNYSFIVRLCNKSSVVMGFQYLDLGTMGTDKPFLTFSTESSYFFCDGEKIDLLSGPSFDANEQPLVFTKLKNMSSNPVSGKILINVYKRLLSQNSVPIANKTLDNFNLSGNEEKSFEIKLPSISTPDSYYATMQLVDNSNAIISGIMSARYVITGPSSKIVDSTVETSSNLINLKLSIAGPADGSVIENASLKVAAKDKSTGAIIDENTTAISLCEEASRVTIPLKISSQTNGAVIITSSVLYNNVVLDECQTFFDIKNGNLDDVKNITETVSNIPQQTIYSKTPNSQPDANSKLTSPIVLKDIQNTPFKESVEKLVKSGVVKGYVDNTFKPYNEITRAEFATLICYLIKKDSVIDNYKKLSLFPDVQKDYWANGFVNIAKNSGLMSGYPDKNFRPAQNISYAEVLTVLVKIKNGGKEVNNQLEWPYNFLKEANSLKIDSKVDFKARTNAIRGNIALFIDNAQIK